MRTKHNILIIPLLSIFVITCCKTIGDVGVAKKLSKNQDNTVMINLGIQNLPDLYFDHYFKYPDNLNELISFAENHADFQNKEADIWKDALKYMKNNMRNTRIISNQGLFILSSCKKVSYNQMNICSLISMKYPERDYSHYSKIINIFNNQGRNLREIIGSEPIDSLITSFKIKVYEMIIKNNFQPISYSAFESDKNKVIILDYNIRTGFKAFCEMERIHFEKYHYFELLGTVCSEFLHDINAESIVFCSKIYE